jgi:hypothetical protein
MNGSWKRRIRSSSIVNEELRIRNCGIKPENIPMSYLLSLPLDGGG